MKLTILAAALLLVAAAPATASALPPIKHVFIVMLENKDYDETFGAHSPAPYLARTLPSLGAKLTNYYGVGHFSLGNYLALISGQALNPQVQALAPGTTRTRPRWATSTPRATIRSSTSARSSTRPPAPRTTSTTDSSPAI